MTFSEINWTNAGQPIACVEPENADAATLAFFDKAEERFSDLLNVFKILGHQPEYGHAFTNMILAILKDGVLSWQMKELLILKTTLENKCMYCVTQHERVADVLGVSTSKVASLQGTSYRNSPEFSQKETALLDYVMQITEDANDVSPRLWDRLKAHCTEAEIVDATFVISTYVSVSKFADALGLELEDKFKGTPLRLKIAA